MDIENLYTPSTVFFFMPQNVAPNVVKRNEAASKRSRTPSREFFIEPLDIPDTPTHRYLRPAYANHALPSQEQSMFLSLPSEIRSRICRFALTEDDGLYFISPCRQRREPRKRDVAGDMKEVLRQGRLCRKGVTHKTWSCGSEENCWWWRLQKEANQLQYVCRELKQETEGLALRVNRVHFVSEEPCRFNAGVLAMVWLESIPSGILQTLTIVTITHTKPAKSTSAPLFLTGKLQPLDAKSDHRANILYLMKICRANPHLTIRYAYPNWWLRPASRSVLIAGITLLYAYRRLDRGDLFPLKHPDDSVKVQEVLEYWHERLDIASEAVSNFRFVPEDWEKVLSSGDIEERFRKFVKRLGGRDVYGEREKAWVRWMVRFYERGI